MRVDTEFPVVHRLAPLCGYRSAVRLSLVPHAVPSIVALVEAVQTLNTGDALRPRFTAGDWRILAAYLVRHFVRSGDTLVRQGEPSRKAFLVESGTLLVQTRHTAGKAAPIALLRAGAVVGEPALFGETTSMAQVDALSPCVIWAFDRVRLDELLVGHPRLACEFLRAAGTVMRSRVGAGWLTGRQGVESKSPGKTGRFAGQLARA